MAQVNRLQKSRHDNHLWWRYPTSTTNCREIWQESRCLTSQYIPHERPPSLARQSRSTMQRPLHQHLYLCRQMTKAFTTRLPPTRRMVDYRVHRKWIGRCRLEADTFQKYLMSLILHRLLVCLLRLLSTLPVHQDPTSRMFLLYHLALNLLSRHSFRRFLVLQCRHLLLRLLPRFRNLIPIMRLNHQLLLHIHHQINHSMQLRALVPIRGLNHLFSTRHCLKRTRHNAPLNLPPQLPRQGTSWLTKQQLRKLRSMRDGLYPLLILRMSTLQSESLEEPCRPLGLSRSPSRVPLRDRCAI
jgi:hypothetical protein